MAQCLLLDTPNSAIETVLQHLDCRDFASLRQVSRSVCRRTTEHVPYIVLLLSDASSEHQLQQWGYMTQQMQYVTNIHIHITGSVPAAVFDMAMQLLSQRSNKVTELHLLAAAADWCSNNKHSWSGRWWPRMIKRSAALLVTLQPLKHLLTHLQQLVIKDIAIRDLADDLRQLAAEAAPAGGWQLQLLHLNAHWGLPVSSLDACAKCCSALLHLAGLFPALKHLHFGVPWREFESVSCIGMATSHDYITYDEADSENGELSDSEAELDSTDSWQESYAADLKERQISAVNLVAAAVNAIAKLKSLERLVLLDIPDIWKPRIAATLAHGSTSQQQQPAVAVTARAAAATTAAPALGSALLPSLSAATAAIATLDDCGCWLLQNLPNMQVMCIMVASAKFCMLWRRRQVQQPLSFSRTCHSSAATSLHQVFATWCPEPRKPSSTSEGSSSGCLVQGFHLHLSRYSSLPVVDLLDRITICELHMDRYNMDRYNMDRLQLATLLGDLKSLEVLEVSVPYVSGGSDTTHVLKATAAPLHKLNSLVFKSAGADQQLLSDLLLPLTAAEGHGSSLELLVVSANLSSTAAAAAATTTIATDLAFTAVLDPSCIPEQQLAPDVVTFCWPHVLLQLDGLRELVIHQVVDPLVDLCVECLPASLEKLECRGVNLISNSAATAVAAASASAVGSDAGHAACISAHTGSANGSSPSVQMSPAAHSLQLRVLFLADCRLTGPNVLASNHLQQLAVINSSWSGGWAAAAAAWPHVSDLAWSEYYAIGNSLCEPIYDARSHGRLDTSGLSYENITHAVQDILLHLRHLSKLTLHVYDFHPWLSVEVLQPLMQHLQHIKHLNLHCSNSSIGSADCMAMKLWLQQQLPWASIGIFSWYYN